jgi:hypothetical protein
MVAVPPGWQTARPPAPPWHVIGLDLGQAQDHSALAVLEARGGPGPPRYAVRHLHRWPLGTRYARIVEDVRGLVRRPPLRWPLLAVDGTGVGAAVVDLFRAGDLEAALFSVLITAGHHAAVGADGRLHAPKKELVSVLQVLLQGRRLEVAPQLEHARTLAAELAAFRVKVTAAANETFESWRERDHDDLVLAVALAAWLAEQAGPPSDGTEDDRPTVIRT